MDDLSKKAEAKEAFDSLFELSQLLNTQLDKETLSICVSLLEAGINPEALAAVVQELRREGAALKEAQLAAEGHA
eukprot:m.12518 g.12518  ORF g.12518 m.12518 type:complete len:75 (+) comp9966_c0_seq1:25-249(+)